MSFADENGSNIIAPIPWVDFLEEIWPTAARFPPKMPPLTGQWVDFS
jgi:hypothetical protein